MNSVPFNGEAILATARRYLGTRYNETSFKCVDFIRAVYREHGFTVPPFERNLREDDLTNPPPGHVLYLKHKETTIPCRWNHAVLVMSADECIHCAYFLGERVVITPMRELLAHYNVA